jgi:phosphate acetyltransferase
MTLPAEILSNRVFDQLQIGDSASLTRTVGPDDITLFATVSGDTNPAHLNPVFAEKGIFGHVIAHGMWTAALVSAVLGTRLPGPGTIYLGQEIRFLRPVTPGDTITATVRVIEKRERDHRVTLETVCTNQNGKDVLSGLATVKAPDEPVSLPVTSLPEVTIQRPSRFQALIAEARALPPVRAGVVHPCSTAALRAAIEVRDEGLLDPLLIGPEAKIRALAEETGLSLDGIGIEPVAHSHAAAARAVELAVSGRVSMLVKGSIRSDDRGSGQTGGSAMSM